MSDLVAIHDDSCGEVIDVDGRCPVCKFIPDMQSITMIEPRHMIARALCCYEWSDDSSWGYHSEAGKEKWRELADLTIRLVNKYKRQ